MAQHSSTHRLRKTIFWSVSAVSLLAAIVLIAVWTIESQRTGPASTTTKSSSILTLGERVRFLHEYVTFRRNYETLDFDIAYHNNSRGWVPGPSDWDVRIVATIPADEIPAWISTGMAPTHAPDAEWMKSVPTALDLSGVNEWYVYGKQSVGFDRSKRIVVYRSSTD